MAKKKMLEAKKKMLEAKKKIAEEKAKKDKPLTQDEMIG